jgi:predicted glycoside hydrolase/deacetylase ChbG (UPF0249 family)
MPDERYLVVTADDFGIGPATTRGILDLASQGLVTGTVLLVNSPHAEEAVREWRQVGSRLELGWHPCLTLDRPVLPPAMVPSLVGDDGCFHRLGRFLRRLLLGRIRGQEIEDELAAQHRRFRDLTGSDPVVVNAHHHVQVFSAVGAALRAVLDRQNPRPYLRRVREPWRTLWRIPGARLKRWFLSRLGRAQARRQEDAGFPGNDWLAGITDPPHLADPEFFIRWLRTVPGQVVELTCHPGYLDSDVAGRDGSFEDGQVHRRPRELEQLQMPAFRQAVREAGFKLVTPSLAVGFRRPEGQAWKKSPAA